MKGEAPMNAVVHGDYAEHEVRWDVSLILPAEGG